MLSQRYAGWSALVLGKLSGLLWVVLMVLCQLNSVQVAGAADVGLPALSNFAEDAAQAKKARIPILVLVSIEGCPYCERIRRQHLIPMSREAHPGALIREVDMHSTHVIKGQGNQSMTHVEFAKRHGIRFAPTVLLLGPGGNLLAEPLVGASIPDFYGAYLDERIQTARSKLAGQ
jgi:thioredoxin-related protein